MGAASIPLAAAAVGPLLSKFLGGASTQQSAAMRQTAQAAPQLMGAGQQTTAAGVQGATTAQNYYKSLLSGGRAGLTAATAPESAAALDYYKGAEGKVTNTMRGGGRDMALAELDRQKVGQLAVLPAQARAGAAQGLVGASAPLINAGANQTQQGLGAAGAGFGQATQVYGQQADAAKGYGKMLFDAISQWQAGRGGGAPSFGKSSTFGGQQWSLPSTGAGVW